jgi:molybdopterin/thiamine biosynthesis adenylyltransferase
MSSKPIPNGTPSSPDARQRQLPAPDMTSWQPVVFDAASASSRAELDALVERQRGIACSDTIEQQLVDYARTLLKDKHAPEDMVRAKVLEVLEGREASEVGSWVYYPWRNQLTHLLPKAMFRDLRLDRNRHRITHAEQSVLLEKCIGIVGLSVGSSGLTTMVLEGVGGKFRIADFDALDVSNLNRLRASVLDVGVNKAVMAARAIFEIDPYLEVEVFAQGIDMNNVDAFFAPPLDVLVEECDDLPMKVRLREIARRAGIPVLMETTDRGMLDVERFDLEPERPLFHGRIGQVDADSLQHASMRDRVPFFLAIVDEQRMSTRLAASLVEIEKSVYTWPQLASAVALGGALLSYSARNLLLGVHRFSGRLYVDFDQLVARDLLFDKATFTPAAASVALDTAPACPPVPSTSGDTLTRSEASFLVEHAVRAPSGGNVQPWRFVYRAGALECHRAPERADTFLDFNGWATRLAIGAAVENATIAAACLGYQTTVIESNEPEAPLVRLGFARQPAGGDEALRRAIFDRVTHRHRAPYQALGADASETLQRQAQALGLHLTLVRELPELRELGRVLGAGDRLRFQIPRYHEEMMRELRWTRAEAERDRTGIELASLEMSAADRAGLDVVRRPDVMQFLTEQKLGAALEDGARKSSVACSAIGLLAHPASMSTLEAGRRLQRLWLESTRSGLAWHPWVALLAMYARARDGADLAPTDRQAILEVGEQLLERWPRPAEAAPLFVFRILENPPAPTARSLRLPLESVFAGGR